MPRLNVNAVRCEALFVSELQRSQEPTRVEIQDAIRSAVRTLGSRGCAARVAQEFGDHPEIAIARMSWARRMIDETFGRTAPRRIRPVAARRERHVEPFLTARAA